MTANVNLERNALELERDMEFVQHHAVKILNANNQVPDVSVLVMVMDFAKVDVIALTDVQVVRHVWELVRDTEFANQNVELIHNVANTNNVYHQDKDMEFVNQDVILILNAKKEEHVQVQVEGMELAFDQ